MNTEKFGAPKRRKRKVQKAKTDKVGPRTYDPSSEDRAIVQALCGFGLSEDGIATYFRLDPKTLRKHFAEELHKARPTLMALANGALFYHLQKKDLNAAKYVHGCLGRKFGWRLDDEKAAPLSPMNALQRMFVDADFSRLTDEQFETLVELLAISGIELPNPNSQPRAGEPVLIGQSAP